MSPHIPDVLERLKCLEQQNDRLHRLNRRVKWAGGVGVGVVLVITLSLSSCTSKSQGPVVQGTVEAEMFVLKDAAGRVHGTFSTMADGPALFLFDPSEKLKPRAGIVATKDGTNLSVYDAAGKERLRLGWSTHGPGVVLLSEEGKPRAGITATERGASVELIDGGRRTELSVLPDAQRLGIYEDGLPRVMLVSIRDSLSLSLIGADRSAVFLENSTEAQRLMFLNSKEVPRIGLTFTPQGPALGLFDDQGRTLFSKP